RLGAAAPGRCLLAAALFATALFFADAMLTPAISVISAVEGLGVVSAAFQPYIVWIALAILIGLFAIQRHGTERVGRMVVPALLLNYLGQAAMLLRHPEFADNPFFHMVPPSLTIPLLVIATLATIIASQAVISGAFSVTQQAIQLGFIPRMRITHTSSHA